MSGETPTLPFSRWWLVVAAAGTIGVAGTYQFVWSSIRVPVGAQVGASEAGLGTVFTLFVIFQTVSQFPAGWVRDRFGPRVPMIAGAALLATGYAGTAFSTSLPAVYLFYTVGGIGAGAAYTVAVNTPVKWFDERRGLATGIVMMTYSGVSFLLIPLVRRSGDIGLTLLGLAALAGGVTLVAGFVLRDPDEVAGSDGRDGETTRGDGEKATDGGGADADATDGREDAATNEATGADATGGDGAYTWREALRTWQFWLLYAVFVVVNGVGLMVIGKVVAFAEALALPPAAATTSASLVALADAAGIFVVSGLSDWLGRERSIAISLSLCGIALAGGVLAGNAGLAGPFVALIAATAFFRSPAFGVFPAIVGSYYGETHSSQNYAALYTAKLWGGVFGGTVASALIVAIGWSPAFLLGAGFITAAGLASFFLRPV